MSIADNALTDEMASRDCLLGCGGDGDRTDQRTSRSRIRVGPVPVANQLNIETGYSRDTAL